MKRNIISIVAALVLVVAAVLVTAVICRQKIAGIESTHAAELSEAKADADALRAALAAEERHNWKEILTDMIRRVDYKNEKVYAIGHKTPDSDSVCSAIGMAYLLNQLGIPAEAKIANELNLESAFLFSELGYATPEILADASGKQLWLVDHSTSSQMVNGAENARIVGITDHHGIGDAETTELIPVLSCPAGSTCSVIYALCDATGVELPRDVASLLLAGLLSDTSNMKSSAVTLLDEAAFAALKTLSGITDTDGLFAKMLEEKMSFKGMTDKEIFYSDYKDYEHGGVRYGIGNVKVARPDLIPAMAERMQNVIKAEMEGGCEADFILYHIYVPDYSIGYTGIVGKDMAFVDELMETVFGDKAEKEGEFYIFRPSLNRKKDIVPPIDAYLDTLQ